mmetsp:Transcript_11696/g.32405  ORF Transcript_11696/g.32405 Transcript_11696/m.32405 type:complete len:231 (-) Transcript_11696:231-923(-)
MDRSGHQVLSKVQRVVVPKLPQDRPGRVHPTAGHEEGVQVHEALEGDALVVNTVRNLRGHDFPDPLELLRLQRRVKARRLEVVELLVAQKPVLVVVAHLKDPLERPHALRFELPRTRVVQWPRRVHHGLLGVRKDFNDVRQLLGAALEADLDLVPLVDQVRQVALHVRDGHQRVLLLHAIRPGRLAGRLGPQRLGRAADHLIPRLVVLLHEILLATHEEHRLVRGHLGVP